MITDLLKVLELLVKVVPALSSPDRRRRQLAHKLADISTAISTVADRAALIVGFMEENIATTKPVALDLILEQQSDLLALEHLLADPIVQRVLAAHIPDFRHFKFMVHPKLSGYLFSLTASYRLLRRAGTSLIPRRGLGQTTWAFPRQRSRDWGKSQISSERRSWQTSIVFSMGEVSTAKIPRRFQMTKSSGY